ncbi:MAG: hypothetical protein OEY56_01155 [Cyclobacteriaceae bacterium]|nr:hypothetical protein [Cyclobacteriaceae bacterium]
MRKTLSVNIISEFTSLNREQQSELLAYARHLKSVEELERNNMRVYAIAEIKKALKEGYSF